MVGGSHLEDIVEETRCGQEYQYLSCITILIVLVQLLIKALVIVNPPDLVQSMLADLFTAR